MKIATSRGFSLIEILISLLILALILLGMNAMEMVTLNTIEQAFHFSTASQQIMNMTERLRALGSQGGLSQQITIWNKQNQRVLPLGRGEVSGVFPHYTVILRWGVGTQCNDNLQLNTNCLIETLI